MRLTVPANPFTEATVMVEFAEEPELAGVGEDAAMVKSTKLKVAVAVWTSVPVVPASVRT